nr:hypothetical protein [Sphingobium sp.]
MAAGGVEPHAALFCLFQQLREFVARPGDEFRHFRISRPVGGIHQMISKRRLKPDREWLDKFPTDNIVPNDRAAAQRDAQTFDRELEGRKQKVAGEVPCQAEIRNARSPQPKRPVIAKDQRRDGPDYDMSRQILGFIERNWTVKQAGAADREKLFGGDAVHLITGPVTLDAVEHRDIAIISDRVRRCRQDFQANLDIGVRCGKILKVRDQAFHRKSAERPDRKDVVIILACRAIHCQAEFGNRSARHIVDFGPCLGHLDFVSDAVEQLDVQQFFKLADLVADGALGQIEFDGRAREAAMSRCGLKRAEPRHGGKDIPHRIAHSDDPYILFIRCLVGTIAALAEPEIASIMSYSGDFRLFGIVPPIRFDVLSAAVEEATP